MRNASFLPGYRMVRPSEIINPSRERFFLSFIIRKRLRRSVCDAGAFDFAIAVARRAKSAGVIIFLFDRK